MINLQNSLPTESGFYFLRYYRGDEIRLHTLQFNSQNELISKEDQEILSEYNDACFSVKLPEYITTAFIKSLNELVLNFYYAVDIEFSINDTEGWDESLSVFIKTHDMLYIFTQEVSGNFSFVKIYGDQSFSTLQKIIS